MISKERLLHLKTRRDIYNTILENPGIHQRELERKTKMPSGALRYHIYRLIKNNIITKKVEKGYIRYFPSNMIGNYDKKILSFLRNKTCRKIIIRFLNVNDVLTKKQLKNIVNKTNWDANADHYNIKLDLTTINYHLQKMIDAGIIERIKKGRKVCYSIVDKDKIIDLIIRYKDTYNDFLVYDSLNTFKSKKYNNIFDKKLKGAINNLKEVFPPPFYM